MKPTKHLSLLFLIILPFPLLGQYSRGTKLTFPDSRFVALRNGTIIQGLEVKKEKNGQFIMVDGVRYPISQVVMYRQFMLDEAQKKAGREYFGIFGIKDGRDYYLKETGNLNEFHSSWNYSFTGLGPTGYSQGYKTLYNKGFGPLKELTYKNLKEDLRDNRRSYAKLKSTRHLQVLGGGLMISGTALGLLALALNNQIDVGDQIFFTGLGVGALGLGCVVISVKRPKAAFRHYNRH
ncbi:MAG: hypothetical protein AAFY71_07705 [Bacteroidota bacterium]